MGKKTRRALTAVFPAMTVRGRMYIAEIAAIKCKLTMQGIAQSVRMADAGETPRPRRSHRHQARLGSRRTRKLAHLCRPLAASRPFMGVQVAQEPWETVGPVATFKLNYKPSSFMLNLRGRHHSTKRGSSWHQKIPGLHRAIRTH